LFWLSRSGQMAVSLDASGAFQRLQAPLVFLAVVHDACFLRSAIRGQPMTSGPSGHASASLLFTYIQTYAAVDSSIAFLYLLRFNLIFSLHCCMKSVRKQVYGQFSVVHAMTGVLAWLESRGVEIQVVLCEACHCFLRR